MLHSDSFIIYSYSLLGYYSEEFQTTQLAVFAVFGAVD